MRGKSIVLAVVALAAALVVGCGPGVQAPAAPTAARPHSYAEPDLARVTGLDLDLDVDFAAHRLRGRATLDVDVAEGARRLVLDTRGLDVHAVSLDDGDSTAWVLGDDDPILGRPLAIAIDDTVRRVHVDYETRPEAAALQWLEPRQTAGGEHPFLFSQSQAILARTWVPIQDTPGVRFTYTAEVRVPPGLLALMSAENPTESSPDGVYRFEMPQPVPSYLLALAVGDLRFRPLGPDTGVYAEPPVIEAAAWEFAGTQAMLDAVEALYGDYVWGRYDLLVLPPSFPWGGMENPRLTFLTPTVIAGDRSLVTLIAHELAHSWSGNLVTNATWNDFWLNEGFTVYLERRIMEVLEGREYAEMLAMLGRQDLDAVLEQLGPDDPDTRLALDLAGRDPELATSDVAYEKGYLFLRMLEEAVGRERFDAFLRRWFDTNAFRSRTTDDFERALAADLLDAERMRALEVHEWLHGTGVPDNAPRIAPTAFDAVDASLAAFLAGADPRDLDTDDWSTHEWLHFVRGLPDGLPAERLASLDAAFGLSDTGNAEILAAWLRRAALERYEPAYPAIRRFLTGQGRAKFLEPIYRALVETGQGDLAREIFAEARPGYHGLAADAVERIVAAPDPS